jgi:hypothetical protein
MKQMEYINMELNFLLAIHIRTLVLSFHVLLASSSQVKI